MLLYCLHPANVRGYDTSQLPPNNLSGIDPGTVVVSRRRR